jgi:ElaB/YqjD/DUF883 family membrane-anchored ribosome-binding protein
MNGIEARRERQKEAVDRRRHELAEALDALHDAVHDPVDLRRLIADRPWLFVSAALVVGFWLGTRTG